MKRAESVKKAKEEEAQAAVRAAAAHRRLTFALELMPQLQGVWLKRLPLLLHPRRELGEELRSAVACRKNL
jgi:hypothetical protein